MSKTDLLDELRAHGVEKCLHGCLTLHVQAAYEIERLRAIVDAPDPTDFMTATDLEARYQRMRWSRSSEKGDYAVDEGKTDADWFWLIGYLAGKALHNPNGDQTKQLHRITTISAAACNWHAAKLGETQMRPGTEQHDVAS